MIDVKTNFSSQYLVKQCNFCDKEETQSHLLECNVILENCEDINSDIDTEYEDIFGPPTKQLKVVQLYQKALNTRDKLLFKY